MFKVPEKYLPNLFLGQEVQLSVEPYPDKIFNGKIFFISPEIEVLTRTFAVKARVANPKKALRPGMFARARLIVEVHENAVAVPWNSVIRTETETYIYLVDGNVARKHPVRIGKVMDGWAEILDSNLAADATVILEGKFAVKDGIEVIVSRQPKDENAAKL
jgi:RND family efflux transporter MFP subunit